MKARFTPWWHLAVALLLGLLAGGFLEFLTEQANIYLLGVPWFISVILLLVGCIILWFAWQVRRYAKGERKEINPQQAVNTLIMSKALSLACSALTGWYGGQLLLSLPHVQIEYYRSAVIQCAIAIAVCIADVIFGIVGERWCRRPPSPGPEHPETKRKAARKKRRARAAGESNVRRA